MRRKGYIRVGWRIVSKSLSKRIPKCYRKWSLEEQSELFREIEEKEN